MFVDREAQDSAVYASFKQDPLNISTAAEFLEHLTVSTRGGSRAEGGDGEGGEKGAPQGWGASMGGRKEG